MTKIKWLSGECIIPNYGIATTGEEKELPEDLAASFISSGQAEEVKLQPIRARIRAGDES